MEEGEGVREGGSGGRRGGDRALEYFVFIGGKEMFRFVVAHCLPLV